MNIVNREGIGFLLVFILIMGGVLAVGIQSRAQVSHASENTQGTSNRVLGDSDPAGTVAKLNTHGAADSIETENTGGDEPDTALAPGTIDATSSVSSGIKSHFRGDDERGGGERENDD